MTFTNSPRILFHPLPASRILVLCGWLDSQGKDPKDVDEKLIAKYGIAVSESPLARRKKAGHANLQYIRHERFFVILATKGDHRFFTEEGAGFPSEMPVIRSATAGVEELGTAYSHVEIDRRQLLDLKAWLTEHAGRATTEELAKAIYTLPVESYAPVRRQLLVLLRDVNRTRKSLGKAVLPIEILPLRRRVVRPFCEGTNEKTPTAIPEAPASCPRAIPQQDARQPNSPIPQSLHGRGRSLEVLLSGPTQSR